MMERFDGKILMIGYGAVAQCTLPILTQHFQMPLSNITVMDFEDKAADLQAWTSKGVHFIRKRITAANMAAVLTKQVGAGDLIIDLAWNIDCCEILKWCHEHGVLYINTSIEIWDPYERADNKPPQERTLYWRHMNLRRMTSKWREPGPTAILEHGANPGLISHFVKKGLLDITARMLKDGKATGRKAEALQELASEQRFNELAMSLGVKVIHCSERDTQISNKPKQPNEFVNTWSIEGFREEGITTAEMGWGTHEKELPPQACEHKEGPRNQICMARMGINTFVTSWVPGHCIRGMVVRHGEAFTISDYLTVSKGGKAVYRPTVHYAYCPCDAAIASLHELRGRDFELQPKLRIMNDDIVAGTDALGALIMGHDYNSWWTGSMLSIEESRKLVPHQNATTVQVAIAVVAATLWMLKNPAKGVCSPEQLPHEFILKIAKPYLGKLMSIPSDWTPLKHHQQFFIGYNHPQLDRRDVWQFKNFLITEGDE